MGRFFSLGLPPFSGAAIVGNGCGESGINLDSTFNRINADHGSGGAWEWRDSAGAPRKTRLKIFADQRGPGLESDLGTQCDYLVYELQTYFPALYAQFRNPGTRTIKNLTANFCWAFENPAPATAGLDNRIARAEQAYADWMVAKPPEMVAQAPTPTGPVVIMPTLQAPSPALPKASPILLPQFPAVVPSDVGRQSAVIDQMVHIQQNYADQIAEFEKEKAIIDSAIASFSGVLPPTISHPALPAPLEVTQASVPRRIPMFKNWQTTASGVGALLGATAAILHSVSVGQMPDVTQVAILFAAVSSGIGLIQAKDKNVTGGTIPQTVEASKRTGTAQ
jgi:Phage tail lysozyme